MQQTCRTCAHWAVTGSGAYGHAQFPPSWGSERRSTEKQKCRCRLDLLAGRDLWRHGDQWCEVWEQTSEIIDECEHCGALLYSYPTGGLCGWGEMFWWEGDPESCEHSGRAYHGRDPRDCGMCQGHGNLALEPGAKLVRCDACGGTGKSPTERSKEK